ncbi:MAG: type II toxin-antitoxin system VapC family toxin [Acidimicrobiia bacterium]
MIVVDTSVWVDHFRRRNARLAGLLEEGSVACHPFVIGELACGNLRDRAAVLSLLASLSVVPEADHQEALALVEAYSLMGSGLGWVDVHLLAAARLAGIGLFTLDRRLAEAADLLGFG